MCMEAKFQEDMKKRNIFQWPGFHNDGHFFYGGLMDS